MHVQLVGQRWAQLPVEERLRYADKAVGHKRQAAGNAPEWHLPGHAAAAGQFTYPGCMVSLIFLLVPS